jgi:hypothetical protein
MLRYTAAEHGFLGVQSVVFCVDVCSRVSEEHMACILINSLQDMDAEMVGRKEFMGYTGKLEEIWSVRGGNEPIGMSSKNGLWTDVNGEL